MTEEEAKVKWCPFARVVRASETGVVAADQAAMNRFDVPDRTKSPQTPLASHCIASACMAWRGKPTVDLTEAKAFVAQDMRINAIKALRVVLPDLSLKEAKDIVCGDAPWPSADGGFCGLAGEPQ